MASISLRIGQYRLLETIGVGTFGKVKLAIQEQTGQKVALKFLNRKRISSMDMVSRIRREVQYLQCLRHPHIIKLFEVVTTPTDIIMVMEYAGGELFDYIIENGKLDENEARRLFQQIIGAVEHCHRHKIVHRDLKPENVLLDERKNVKIADFGLSNLMRDGDFLQTSCGSPNYASPEVISGKLYAGSEVDIWSCGVILFVMVTGKLPFDDENIPKLFKKINEGQISIPSYISADLRQLLQQMIQVDPLKRITIQGIRDTPWFQKNLPDYLSPLPELRNPSLNSVDDKLVVELIRKMGISKEEVYMSLGTKDEKHNPIRVAYQLLADQQRMAWSQPKHEKSTSTSSSFSLPFVLNISPPSLIKQPPSPSKSTTGKDSSSAVAHLSSTSLTTKTPSPTIRPLSMNSDTGLEPPRRHATVRNRSKWHYGIRSRSHPLDIMSEIYEALKQSGMEWKIIQPFHIRVRIKESVDKSFPCSNLKFDITLYRSSDDSYLVDFKNVPQSVIRTTSNRTNKSIPDDEEDNEQNSLNVYSFFKATTQLISYLALH